MFKTFTLDRIVDEQLTETEGKRTFHITDESGYTRTVWGTTLINDAKVPLSITASKKREHPLIQCLFDPDLKQTINIEFTQYNSMFERKDEPVNAPFSVEEIAKNMETKSVRVGSLVAFSD